MAAPEPAEPAPAKTIFLLDKSWMDYPSNLSEPKIPANTVAAVPYISSLNIK